MANRDARLVMFSGRNFTGRRLVMRRGGVAIRDMEAIRYTSLSSFRLSNVVEPDQVTLVLFSGTNFQGSFRVFRGTQNVADLGTRDFDNETDSLILVGSRLTNAQINRIQSTGNPPAGILIINR